MKSLFYWAKKILPDFNMREIKYFKGQNMQISNVQNQNFGRFCCLNKQGNLLTRREQRIVGRLIGAIDETEGRTLCVFADIARPVGSNGHKHIRITTTPLISDFEKIKSMRPDAVRSDYKRHSLWFELSDKSLKEKVMDFLIGQNGYIHYCKKDPAHRLQYAPSRKVEFQV
ncbi:MAG: hypothetical protein K6A44_00625 [bacterium]|nr:hypothetical protein [bacterium]